MPRPRAILTISAHWFVPCTGVTIATSPPPVVQLSIDESQLPSFHYELGRKLVPLRSEGVLIVGSGPMGQRGRSSATRGRSRAARKGSSPSPG